MAGYYYLVASLNEYSLSGDSKQLDFNSIREEILNNISKSDSKLLSLMLSYWDIQNFLNVIEGRENQYSYIGNYTQEQIAYIAMLYGNVVEFAEKTQEEKDLLLEEFKNFKSDVKISAIFETIFKKVAEGDDSPIAKLLLEEYYRKLRWSRNKFLSAWGYYDRSVKNLSAAFEARKQERPIESEIIGKGLICRSILENSKLVDFGLSEREWVEEIIKILSSNDIIKKEKGLDIARWNFIEESLEFEYFSINFVLGYVMKLTMISRWLQLDEKIGREMFDKLVGQIISPDLINVEQ